MSSYYSTSDVLALSFNQMLGGLSVSESKGVITLSKFPGTQVINAIDKQWKTSTITKYMFNKAGYFKLEFYSFFAVEVVYIFEKLIAESRLMPGTKGLLREAISKMKEETWLRDTTRTFKSRMDRNQLKKFKKSPLPFQDEFFKIYEQSKQRYHLDGYLLSAPPGTGKTLTNLFISEMLQKDITIVLCPKPAREDPWAKTLENEFHEAPTYWMSGTGKPLDNLNYRYLIVHYESIGVLKPFIKDLRRMNTMIVLDESHNMNDIKADRTTNFVQLCNLIECNDILPGSGTPIKAITTEMIPFLKSTDKLFTEAVEARFKKIFGVSKARANDIMCNRMGIITHRIDKKESVDNEVTEFEHRVTFPGCEAYMLKNIRETMRAFIEERMVYYKEHADVYKKMYNEALKVFESNMVPQDWNGYQEYQSDVAAIIKTGDLTVVKDEIARANRFERKVIQPKLAGKSLHDFKDSKSVVKYVTLKVRGEALGRILGRARAECHVDMIKYAQLERFVEDAEKKTLIFTSYVDVVKSMTDYFSDKDKNGRYKPLPVYTETSGSLRKMIHEFATDQNKNPMIATYQMLSTAVPLTMASTVILFNQPFRDYEKNQATARVDRKGQDAPVTIVNVLLDTGDEPNISTRSLDILQWSKEQVEQITGVKSDAVSLEEYGLGVESIDVVILGDHKSGQATSLDDRFHCAIAKYLHDHHNVLECEVLGYDEPQNIRNADLYIAHGAGDRMTQYVIDGCDNGDLDPGIHIVGFNTPAGINSPDVTEWQEKQRVSPDITRPPRGHYVLTNDQKQALDELVASIKMQKLGLEYFEMEQSIHQQYFHISSHIPSLEHYDDLVPGVEGLFDGAKKLVDRIFSVNIDKGRVKPYSTGWSWRGKVKKLDYADLADFHVVRPEGLNVPYSEYAKHLEDQFMKMDEFLSQAFASARKYLAVLASDDAEIGSMSSSDFNVYLNKYKLNDQKDAYAKLFAKDLTTTAAYSDMIKNNKEWQSLDDQIARTQLAYLKLVPTDIEKEVDLIYDILDDILDRMKHDNKAKKMSKVQIKDITTMAYSLASTVEFYSVLMFGWQLLNQSLVETEKKLTDAF